MGIKPPCACGHEPRGHARFALVEQLTGRGVVIAPRCQIAFQCVVWTAKGLSSARARSDTLIKWIPDLNSIENLSSMIYSIFRCTGFFIKTGFDPAPR